MGHDASGNKGRRDEDRLEDHLADREFERAMRQLGVGRTRRQRQAEDDALFERAMGAGDEPRPAGRTGGPAPVAPTAPRRGPNFEEDDALFEAAMGLEGMSPRADEPEAPSRSPEERVDGTPRTLKRRIKSGQFRAAPTLDLHGLRRDAAREAVDSFLRRAAEQGHAAVRIIPGRGLHSRDHAVLQEALNQWLRRDFRDRVREVVAAPMAQGGSGAVFVFLRPAGS